MKKTILAIVLTTIAIIAAPHQMEIIGTGSHQVPVGGAGTQLNGNTLTIVQEGMSGAHDHAIDIDLSNIAGKDGTNGKDGKDGSNGIDGINGAKGDTGNSGNNGTDGTDGTDGIDGVDGSNGKDGYDGNDGKNGKDGINGKDGTSVNIDNYIKELQEYQTRVDDLSNYTAASAAGAMAISSIDFGTHYEGSIEIGAGVGMSGTGNYGSGSLTGYAGGAGVKYGLTVEDALTVKAWYGNHNAYGIGAGVTHRF